MATQVTNGLNLNKTAIINALMHPVAGDVASPVEGQLWYNSALEALRLRLSSSTITLAAGGAGISELVEDDSPQLGGNLDTNGFTVAGRNIAADGGVLDTALQPTDADASGFAFVSNDGTMAGNSATEVVTEQAVVTYVTSQLSNVSSSVDEYNASTNTPDLDVSPGSIAEGAQFYVTADGLFFTEQVRVGDLLIARQDDPTARAHWVVVQRNIDQATESQAGIAPIASQVEVDAGVDDTKIVTPAKLGAFPRKVTGLIGDGSTAALVFAHNLGTKDVVVQVREVSSDELVLADVEATTTAAVTVTFATAPATDAFSVTVIG